MVGDLYDEFVSDNLVTERETDLWHDNFLIL